jgi:hypothetical protein
MMNKHGDPWPVFHAKRLCTRHVRHGDWISFPTGANGNGDVDVVLARGEDGRRSALVVHLADGAATYAATDLTGGGADYQTLLKIDQGTGNRVAQAAFDGTVSFEGHGVAVVTTAAPEADRA